MGGKTRFEKNLKWGWVPTAFGTFLLAWGTRGVAAVVFPGERKSRRRVFRNQPPCRVPQRFRKALQSALAGKKPPPLPLSFGKAPPFYRKIWNLLRRVPPGKLVTYRALACAAGVPRAARAVGRAMAENPLPLFIPCHRVVAEKSWGGYSLGLSWKKKLLAKEGIPVALGFGRAAAFAKLERIPSGKPMDEASGTHASRSHR